MTRAALVHLRLVLFSARAHMSSGVIIHIGFHPGALSDMLMIAVRVVLVMVRRRRNHFLDETGGCRARRCIVVDILPAAASLLHCCVIVIDAVAVVERRRSLRWRLTIARLLMANRHVALVVVVPAAAAVVVVLTNVAHLTVIFSAHRRPCVRRLLPTPASSLYLRFFASDPPYRTRVVFAEVDAILLAVCIGGRLGGEVVVIHNIISHCIQRAHIVFHGCVVVGLNSLGSLLLD